MINRKFNQSLKMVTLLILILNLVLPSETWSQSATPGKRVSPKKYRFVHYYPDAPALSPFDIVDNMDDLSLEINRASNSTIEITNHIFKRREDFEAFSPGTQVDFMVIDPLYYLEMNQRNLYQPLLIMNIQGSIVHRKKLIVLQESQWKCIKDLHRTILAVTLPSEREVAILTNLYFNSFIDPIRFFKSIKKVDNSASALLSVMYKDAAGALVPTYNKGYRDHLSAGKIRTIYETTSIPNGIFAVNTKTVSPQFIKAIIKRFLHLQGTVAGQEILKKLRITSWTILDDKIFPGLAHDTTTSRWQDLGSLMEACYLSPPASKREWFTFPRPSPIAPHVDQIPEPIFSRR
ncbi:phosphate/phosphite/phosphonate ABC transporter substrate-binding protein [candidate division CSSED10-310 bacterium]|uniref:Phosphate/phosphite/phosphonate ABC transporter substrate-binding protein n=1 Tax=candidate division CSSED10-310 bacterium TaxID=2855610 RepID=A0ABV6YYB1_UNCC1